MEQIGNIQIINELKKFNDNISLWLTEAQDGMPFEILTIKKNKDYQPLLDRLLKNEIQPLANREITGIQKVVRTDFDPSTQIHFIVYEKLDDEFQELKFPAIKSLKNLLKGLDALKRENRFSFALSPENILTNQKGEVKLRFVGLFELFRHQKLLNETYVAPEVKEWIADSKQPRPNFQADIYSSFKSFDGLIADSDDEILKSIFQKALFEKRTERFSKYSDILSELEKVKESEVYLRNKNRLCIKVMIKHGDEERFSSILSEMNESCFMFLDSERSKHEKKQITGLFSTKNYSGRFFVDDQNHIFIPLPREPHSPNYKVIKNGFACEYGFDYSPSKNLNCVNFFTKQFEILNKLNELNNTKHDLVEKWLTLPEQERDYAEETAFKAQYVSREESKNNTANIKFTLTEEFRDWEKIKLLKRDEIDLSIDDKIIGKIQDYNPANCFLIIRDTKATIDEISEKGELLQDVRMETSQFKKQLEACKKFEHRNIVNPELCSILATPERVSSQNKISLFDSDYENFKAEVFNLNLKTDNTQRDAVLEALHYKPVYLIQGPPGTGKTTVIVELIQQIIRQKGDAKILVTSQSNLAVDNVLEKLPEQISFMRLVVDEERIGSEKIKEHSYQSKLKKWIKDTQNNSETFFQNYFSEKITDKALVRFFNSCSNIGSQEGDNFKRFQWLLSGQNQYLKGLFENAKSIKDTEKVFNEKLGQEFQNLRRVQKDWFAFLLNADSTDGQKKKSMLNDGSLEIDFRTAFAKSVNVIGATCIHIASNKYSKINFRFDYVIMDESSKASPAETLVPINMGQNIILIGDHHQLPPVITREEAVKQKVRDKLEDNGLDFEKEFGESLFEKLITDFQENQNLHGYIKMLDIQYRMPRQVGNLISRFFYEGKLKNPDISLPSLLNFDSDKFHGIKLKKPTTIISDALENKEIEVPNSVVFVSTSKRDKPYDNDNKFNRSNTCNRDVIKEILSHLNSLYIDNLKRKKPFEIGIIAGYRGQVNLLQDTIELTKYENFLKKNEEGRPEPLIEINTVDKFQGAERDIIIYDLVKSSKGSSSIGFLDDYRRINVAFSRVKRLLIVVGDSEYLLKRATMNPQSKFEQFKLKEIAQELEKQGVIVYDFKEILQ